MREILPLRAGKNNDLGALDFSFYDGSSNNNFILNKEKSPPVTSVRLQAGDNIIESVSHLPVTINFHHWCLTMENFTQSVTTLPE